MMPTIETIQNRFKDVTHLVDQFNSIKVSGASRKEKLRQKIQTTYQEALDLCEEALATSDKLKVMQALTIPLNEAFEKIKYIDTYLVEFKENTQKYLFLGVENHTRVTVKAIKETTEYFVQFEGFYHFGNEEPRRFISDNITIMNVSEEIISGIGKAKLGGIIEFTMDLMDSKLTIVQNFKSSIVVNVKNGVYYCCFNDQGVTTSLYKYY